MEKSFRNRSNAQISDEGAQRAWFARQLWRAFPEAKSEHELAEIVAEVLTTDRRPVHARTVINWLRCNNAPAFRYVMGVLALAGSEAVIDLVEGRAE